MSLGVQLAAGAFRSIRSEHEALVLRSCAPRFCVLQDTPAVRQRLQESSVRYQICREGLLVIGQWFDAWAGIALSSPQKLLPYGRVPVGDPVSRQLLALAIEAVVPEAPQRGDLCCLSIPCALPRESLETDANLEHLSHLVLLRGWEPRFVNAGLALVLAELGPHRLTGMGVVIDDEATQASIVVCGKEIAAASVRHAARFDMADGQRPPTEAFRDQLVDAFDALRREVEGTLTCALPGPVTLACAGIETEPELAELIREAWEETGWRQRLEHVLSPRTPAAAVARGCLIHAELEAVDRRKAA